MGSRFEYLSDFTEDIKSPKVLSGCVIFTLSEMEKEEKRKKKQAQPKSHFFLLPFFCDYQKKLRLNQRLKRLGS